MTLPGPHTLSPNILKGPPPSLANLSLCNPDDVANAWATSVSSRSISYRQAMVFGTIFEMLGAITVGARTAETIKNGIIPSSAFQNTVLG